MQSHNFVQYLKILVHKFNARINIALQRSNLKFAIEMWAAYF